MVRAAACPVQSSQPETAAAVFREKFQVWTQKLARQTEPYLNSLELSRVSIGSEEATESV